MATLGVFEPLTEAAADPPGGNEVPKAFLRDWLGERMYQQGSVKYLGLTLLMMILEHLKEEEAEEGEEGGRERMINGEILADAVPDMPRSQADRYITSAREAFEAEKQEGRG